jgi:hypothetical protein
MGDQAVARSVLSNVYVSLSEEDAQILAEAGKKQQQQQRHPLGAAVL